MQGPSYDISTDMKLSAAAMRGLCKAFATGHLHIEKLDLSRQSNLGPYLPDLCCALRDYPYLKQLILPAKDLSHVDFTSLIHLLRCNPYLTDVKFKGAVNSIYEIQLKTIVQAAEENKSFNQFLNQLNGGKLVRLKYLDLSGKLKPRFWKYINEIADKIDSLTHLEEIDLSKNGLSYQASAALLDKIAAHGGMIRLNLSFNHLKSDSLAALGAVISSNPLLMTLDVSHNPLESPVKNSLASSHALSDMLKHIYGDNRSHPAIPVHKALTHINMSHTSCYIKEIHFSKKQSRSLCRYITKHNLLVKFNLSFCNTQEKSEIGLMKCRDQEEEKCKIVHDYFEKYQDRFISNADGFTQSIFDPQFIIDKMHSVIAITRRRDSQHVHVNIERLLPNGQLQLIDHEILRSDNRDGVLSFLLETKAKFEDKEVSRAQLKYRLRNPLTMLGVTPFEWVAIPVSHADGIRFEDKILKIKADSRGYRTSSFWSTKEKGNCLTIFLSLLKNMEILRSLPIELEKIGITSLITNIKAGVHFEVPDHARLDKPRTLARLSDNGIDTRPYTTQQDIKAEIARYDDALTLLSNENRLAEQSTDEDVLAYIKEKPLTIRQINLGLLKERDHLPRLLNQLRACTHLTAVQLDNVALLANTHIAALAEFLGGYPYVSRAQYAEALTDHPTIERFERIVQRNRSMLTSINHLFTTHGLSVPAVNCATGSPVLQFAVPDRAALKKASLIESVLCSLIELAVYHRPRLIESWTMGSTVEAVVAQLETAGHLCPSFADRVRLSMTELDDVVADERSIKDTLQRITWGVVIPLKRFAKAILAGQVSDSNDPVITYFAQALIRGEDRSSLAQMCQFWNQPEAISIDSQQGWSRHVKTLIGLIAGNKSTAWQDQQRQLAKTIKSGVPYYGVTPDQAKLATDSIGAWVKQLMDVLSLLAPVAFEEETLTGQLKALSASKRLSKPIVAGLFAVIDSCKFYKTLGESSDASLAKDANLNEGLIATALWRHFIGPWSQWIDSGGFERQLRRTWKRKGKAGWQAVLTAWARQQLPALSVFATRRMQQQGSWYAVLEYLVYYPLPNGERLAWHLQEQRWERMLQHLITEAPEPTIQDDPAPPIDTEEAIQAKIRINTLNQHSKPQRVALTPSVVSELCAKEWLLTTPEEDEVLGDFNPRRKLVEESTGEDAQVAHGLHLVIPIKGAHLKVMPDFPGMELTYSLLHRRVVGVDTSHVALWRWSVDEMTHYPVLVSETLAGINLTQALLAKTPLASKPYGQLVLMAMLTNPGDGNPGNFLARLIRTDEGEKLHLGAIDNDRLFAPPFEAGRLRVATLLYCFNEMKAPLDSEARDEFLALNPYQLLSSWLNDLEHLNTAYRGVFLESDLADYLEKGRTGLQSYVLSLFKRETIRTLFGKLRVLQYWLRRHPELPLIDLLSKIHPSLASHYRVVLAQSINPIQRFEKAVGSQYRRDEIAGIIRYTSTVHMAAFLKLQGRDVRDTAVGNAQAEDFIRARQELLDMSTDEQGLELARRSLLHGDPKRLTELPTAYAQSEVIARLDWTRDLSGLDSTTRGAEHQQQALFNILMDLPALNRWERLVLKRTTMLNAQQLADLVKRMPQLRYLRLEGTGFDGNIGSWRCPALEECLIDDSAHLKSLWITTKRFPEITYLSLKRAESLTQLTITSPSLKHLNLAGCRSVSTLDIKAPRLEEIDLEGCELLTDAHLKRLVQNCPDLKQMHLSGCNPETITYMPIKEAVPLFAVVDLSDEALKSLAGYVSDLLGNAVSSFIVDEIANNVPMTNMAFRVICLALGINRSVKKVQVGIGMGFGDAVSMPILGVALADSGVEDLSLEMTAIGDAGAQMVADLIANLSNLRKIKLSCNGWSRKASLKVMKALVHSRTIKEVSWIYGKLPRGGLKLLAQALKGNLVLESLDMALKGSATAEWVLLFHALRVNRTLKDLRIVMSKFNDKVLGVLGEALAHNTTLVELLFTFCNFSDKGFKQFANGLARNQTLTKLEFDFCRIGDKKAILLAKALVGNTSLISLKLENNPIQAAGREALEELQAQGVTTIMSPVKEGASLYVAMGVYAGMNIMARKSEGWLGLSKRSALIGMLVSDFFDDDLRGYDYTPEAMLESSMIHRERFFAEQRERMALVDVPALESWQQAELPTTALEHNQSRIYPSDYQGDQVSFSRRGIDVGATPPSSEVDISSDVSALLIGIHCAQSLEVCDDALDASVVNSFLSSGHGAQSMEERIAAFKLSARAIIDMYQTDFTMSRITDQQIHIALPALDDPRYGAPLFGSKELLQETLEEFKNYLVTALGNQGLFYEVTGNRLVITAVSPEKAQAVETFLRAADCWFENVAKAEESASNTNA